MVPAPLSAEESAALADMLGALVAQIQRGQLIASRSMVAMLVGARTALLVEAGHGDVAQLLDELSVSPSAPGGVQDRLDPQRPSDVDG